MNANTQLFYFTYGMEGQPYSGGWTTIRAVDRRQACCIFEALHPSDTGFLRCAAVYSEEQFMQTAMWQRGDNLGAACHEMVEVHYLTGAPQ